MSDLDFEELDRAINDLYESLDDDEPAAEPDAAPTQSVESAHHRPLPRNNEPKQTPSIARTAAPLAARRVPRTAAKASATRRTIAIGGAEPAATTVVAAQRNKGHFMDMVHPSSDAMVQHKHNFAAERQARVHKPAPEVTNVIVNKPKTSKINVDRAADADSSVDAKPPVPHRGVISGHRRPMTIRRTTLTSNANQRSRHDLVQPLPRPTVSQRSTTMAESATITHDYHEVPFLPDAKVIKRPLGGGQAVAGPISQAVIPDAKQPTKSAASRRIGIAVHESTSSTQSDSTERHGDRSTRLAGEQPRDRRDDVNRRHRERMGDADQPANKLDRPGYSDYRPAKPRHTSWRLLLWALAFVGIVGAGVLIGLIFYYYF